MVKVLLGDIVAALGGELLGSAEKLIERISPLGSAGPTSISFLANMKLQSQLSQTAAGCVIVPPGFQTDAASQVPAWLVTPDPYLYFARLTQWWVKQMPAVESVAIHPTAVVHPEAQIGKHVSIGPGAVVEAQAVLEDGVQIGALSFVGRQVRLGSETRLAPRVTILAGCQIGQACYFHSGVVIGADGFGFAPIQGVWEKIEQLGAVRIGNDVEIGANTCIDRGALEDTVIEDGVKLDNLIQIGHNVRIGKHTVMAGCVGVAGSTTIGAHCRIGGAVNIGGHLSITDRVDISGATSITRSIFQSGVYGGPFPFDHNANWEKNAATLRNLYNLRERIRALEKQFKS